MDDEDEQLPAGSYQVLAPSQGAGTPATIYFRPSSESDLEAVYALEVASYPADEAATREKLAFRLQDAAECFLIAVEPAETDSADPRSLERIVGFTCGTCATGEHLTYASMSSHDPQGTLLCIHSVVVDPTLRRKGIATRMLKAYLMYVQAASPHVERLALLCKEDLIKLYEGAGFTLVGPSDVVHGQELWYEMNRDLH